MEAPKRVIELERYLSSVPRGAKESDLHAKRTHYSLHPNMQYLAQPKFIRHLLTRACAEQLRVHEVPVFRPCLVASLRDCFDPTNPYRARVCFDLDTLAGDPESFAPFELQACIDLICAWLQEYTTIIDASSEYLYVFSGSFADKRISVHVYFPELCWAREPANAYRENLPALDALNQQLRAFGLVCDASITNGGIKYAFMDKWTKAKMWRGDVQHLQTVAGPVLPKLDLSFWSMVDPHVYDDDEPCVEISFAPHAHNPKRRRAEVADVNVTTIVTEADTVQERLIEAIPAWRGCTFRRVQRSLGLTVWIPSSTFCPFKEVATDVPAFMHETPKCYAVATAVGGATVRCWICVGRELSIEGPALDTDPAVQQILELFNSQYALLEGDKVLRYPVDTIGGSHPYTLYTQKSFIAQEQRNERVIVVDKKRVQWCKFWLGHDKATRFPLGRIFDPSCSCDPRYYNTYRGIDSVVESHYRAIDQVDESRFAHYLRMLRSNICCDDEVASEYLLNWMAHTVQKPEIKMGVMIVMTGTAGAGKGATARMWYNIWGKPHGLQIEGSDMTADFNFFLAEAIAVFVDETGRTNDVKLQNRIKSLITETNMLSRQKYVDQAPIKSYANFMCASNGTAVHLQVQERRFAVFTCDRRINEELEPDFFTRVHAEVDDPVTRAHFYAWLLQRDLSRFVYKRYPITAATQKTLIDSFDVYNRYIYRLLHTGCLWETKRDWPSDAVLGTWTAYYDRFLPKLPHGASINVKQMGEDIFDEPRLPQPFELMREGLHAMQKTASDAELSSRLATIFGENYKRSRASAANVRLQVFELIGPIAELRKTFLAHIGNADDRLWETM